MAFRSTSELALKLNGGKFGGLPGPEDRHTAIHDLISGLLQIRPPTLALAEMRPALRSMQGWHAIFCIASQRMVSQMGASGSTAISKRFQRLGWAIWRGRVRCEEIERSLN